MSKDISIKLQNFDEIQELFRVAPAKITKGVHDAIARSILIIQRNAMREAPVNKASGGGTLRQSIKAQMRGTAVGEVTVEAMYAIFVHEGTRPHTITPRVKKALANTSTGQFFGRLVQHPGTRANPFLERAVEKSEGDVNKEFDKIIDKAFL